MFVLFILCGVLVYRSFYPTVTFRQKITVSMATPNGVVSGSTVVKVTAWRTPMIVGAGGRYNSVEGEAVALQLGDGKWLFMLMDGYEYIFARAYQKQEGVGLFSVVRDIRKMRQQKSPLRVPKNGLPTFVTFGDLTDPDSLFVVDPADLQTVFGEGYNLVEVTVNYSRDQISHENLLQVWPCLAHAAPCRPWARSNPWAHPLQHKDGAYFRRVSK